MARIKAIEMVGVQLTSSEADAEHAWADHLYPDVARPGGILGTLREGAVHAATAIGKLGVEFGITGCRNAGAAAGDG